MNIDLNSAIAGAVLSLSGGIILLCVTKAMEEYKNKKVTAKVILSEISINQEKIDTQNYKFVDDIKFNRIVFSTASNNIGLLPVEVEKKILHYYALLKDIEETKTSYLVASTVDTDNEKTMKKTQENDLEEKANETHDLGVELIKILK